MLVLQLDAVPELGEPHKWYVDAIGRGHGCQGHQPASQGWSSSSQSVEGKGGNDGATGCPQVADTQSLQGNGTGAAAVSVVDHCVERLIAPLPEYHCWRGSGWGEMSRLNGWLFYKTGIIALNNRGVTF